MTFKVLLTKNWIYWKRNKVASVFELLIPVVLCLLMILIKNLIVPTKYPKVPPNLISAITSTSIAPNSDISAITKKFKDCSQSGYIALAPQFLITDQLDTFFKSLNYTTRFFTSNDAIDAEVHTSNYTYGTYGSSLNQICFGIVFDSHTSSNYSYSLRFNSSLGSSDTYKTQSSPRINYKLEDLASFNKTVNSGILQMQILIDAIIVNMTGGIDLSVSYEKFVHPSYDYANYSTTLANMIVICLILSSMISFLRVISHVVGERESKIIESMENMGLSKGMYLLSVYVYMFTLQFILSIVVSILLKVGVLFNVNWLAIFLMYFSFIMSNISIALFISCFFTNSKRAVITGLVVFLCLFLFYILKSSVSEPSAGLAAFIAITPTGAVNQLIINFLTFADYFQSFSFSEMNFVINNFAARTYYIVSFVEWFAFTLLSFYVLYVYPLDIGLVKHPLFFLGFGLKPLQTDNVLDDKSLIDSTNFEAIEKELEVQRALNKSVKISNLVKVFKGSKVAVNNLNLEMFSNQIFALLGHNGAGKTTTISMISGLLPITSGAINIFGLDSRMNHEEIKKIIGICPQSNIIFEYMTVNEHMELYWDIKSNGKKNKDDIDKLLKEMDLYHKKDYLAGKLSGGQKRKLCVAIAFIGNSKLILLDEPTAGMDTYARRHLWEMLKKYKNDKIIVLTTHNMDEADFLGDRIGIMSEGKLVTCGSSIFLKNKFGEGYELTILKKSQSASISVDKIKNLIFQYVPNASFISEIGIEVKFCLPETVSGFKELFQNIETKLDELGIQSFGIDLNTLEEVFIKVAKNSADPFIVPVQDASVLDKEVSSTDPTNMDLKQLTENNQNILSDQISALLKKRYVGIVRDWGTIICEIFCPVLIVIIGLIISKINFITQSPKLLISDQIYKEAQNFTCNSFDNAQNSSLTFLLNQFNSSSFSYNQIMPTSLLNFAEVIYAQNYTDQLLAMYFTDVTPNYINYTILVNTTAPFIPFVAINQLSNAILKSHSLPTAISFSIDPLELTDRQTSLNASISGFIVVILIIQAMAMIPNSLIQFIVKEREKNSKHQQIVSGVSYAIYWLTNWIIDYIKYLIPGLTIFALFFAFGATFFTDGQKAAYSFIIIIVYGDTMIGLTYLLAFLFKTPGIAQISAFILFSFVAFALVIVSYVLKVIPSTSDIGINVIPYIFNLFSPFSFGNALMNLANDTMYKNLYGWTYVPGPFTTRISLNELIYLICFGLFFYTLIFLIEYSYKFQLKKQHQNYQQVQVYKSIQLDDADVVLENESVKNQTKAFSVFANDLHKNYGSKKAIDGITFGVEKGTLFTLLGTNGAGKTTTFKILTGEERASSGRAVIRGMDLPEQLSEIRSFVGYCPQFDSLCEKMTAYEHLSLYCSLKGIEKKYHSALIENMLVSMNLTKYRDIVADEYSGGNKRKLSIAIALIGHPPIIFLDEPCAGMDPEARRFVWSFIADITNKRAQSSIILTTHSMEEAQALSNKVAIMVEGRIKTVGTVQQLKDKYGNGYEIEIKFKLFSNQQLETVKSKYESKVKFRDSDSISKDELDILIDSFDLGWLKPEISQNGRGSAIWQQLDTEQCVEAKFVIEWIEIQTFLQEFKVALQSVFKSTLVESFQSYAKFNIIEKCKLSAIFAFIEGELTKERISNFAIREISLEQIFIQFARNVVRQD